MSQDNKELIEQLTKEKQAQSEVINELHTKLENYTNLGEPEDIDKALSLTEELHKKLKGIDVGSLHESLDRLKLYEEIGTPEDIDKAIDMSMSMLEEYKKIGKPDELSEALDKAIEVLEQYKPLGSPKDIDEAFDKVESLLNRYKELGTPEEIDEALDLLAERVLEDRSESIAAKYDVAVDTVKKMYESVKNFDAIDALLSDSFKKATKTTPFNENKESKIAGYNEPSFLRRSSRNL